jgi:hypothetical protein
VNVRRNRPSAGPRTVWSTSSIVDAAGALDAEQEAALDEDDPPDSLGVAGDAGDGDEPAHRVPDDGCGAGADAVEDGDEVVGGCVDAERPGDRRTRAAAPQVRCDQRAAAVERAERASAAQGRWLAETPWAAATGSPGDPPTAPTTSTQAASQSPGWAITNSTPAIVIDSATPTVLRLRHHPRGKRPV